MRRIHLLQTQLYQQNTVFAYTYQWGFFAVAQDQRARQNRKFNRVPVPELPSFQDQQEEIGERITLPAGLVQFSGKTNNGRTGKASKIGVFFREKNPEK